MSIHFAVTPDNQELAYKQDRCGGHLAFLVCAGANGAVRLQYNIHYLWEDLTGIY